MTVYALMPVFNRLEMTRAMLDCLNQQVLDEPLRIVVVDDGSTDGTGEFLKGQADVTTLKGDGSLWWGGGIDRGLQHILREAGPQDWLLFVNNDTELRPEFVQQLLDAARRFAPAAVGSVIRDLAPPHRLLSIGPQIDVWGLRVRDALDSEGAAVSADDEVTVVDALSGRGVLYSLGALRAVGGMRPRWLPHYLADYELSIRVRKAGYKLCVSHMAAVYSHDQYGSQDRAVSLKERLLSVRSPTYLPAMICFWWEASNWRQRLGLPWRAALAWVFRRNRG